MQQHPSPHEPLFVPMAPATPRGARVPGIVVLCGGITMIIGSLMPWEIVRVGGQVQSATVYYDYGMLTVAMGAATLIAGVILRSKDTSAARLLVRVAALLAVGVGIYALYDMFQSNRQLAALMGGALGRGAPLASPGTGLYILGIGALLAVLGSFLRPSAYR